MLLNICVAAGHRLLMLLPNLLREALQCIHMGLTMEHLAMCIQISIKIDRLDLARESLNLLKQADEDLILAQLTAAYIAIGQRISRSDDAEHIFAGSSEQYGSSLMLRNCMTVALWWGPSTRLPRGN